MVRSFGGEDSPPDGIAVAGAARAVQFDKLLATSDGTNWEDVGTINPSVRDCVFTSPTQGIAMTPCWVPSRKTATRRARRSCASTIEGLGIICQAYCDFDDTVSVALETV
jgi:hypothetical protein